MKLMLGGWYITTLLNELYIGGKYELYVAA